MGHKEASLAKWRSDSPQSQGGWPTTSSGHDDANAWRLGDSYIGERCPNMVREQLEERLRRPRTPDVTSGVRMPAVHIAPPSWIVGDSIGALNTLNSMITA